MKLILAAAILGMTAGAAFAQGGTNYDRLVDLCANNGETLMPMEFCACRAKQFTERLPENDQALYLHLLSFMRARGGADPSPEEEKQLLAELMTLGGLTSEDAVKARLDAIQQMLDTAPENCQAVAQTHVTQYVWSQLSSEFRGPSRLLDIADGGLTNDMTLLTPEGNGSGQNWQFTYGGSGPALHMSTELRGQDMCLGVVEGGEYDTMAKLGSCEFTPGHAWLVEPAGEGTFRIKTRVRGQDMCLDVYNGGPLSDYVHVAPCGNYSGQLWRIAQDASATTIPPMEEAPADAAPPAEPMPPAEGPTN